MNEENNQEEEYVEEEIEVYEEVEVDEEEEKNDSSLPKEKSINKINTIKSNSLLQNETDITEEKKENTNNNELQSLNDKIRYEEIENNTEKNNENFEKINTIIKNKENNNSEIKMNLFFDGGTEENKYLNLDYKIKTEKDSDELLNNNITPNKNKILEENNTNKELNFENNKNDNINSIRPQSNNFRSKIKRNNKKINKIDPNSNNNKINNFINTNLPQENNTNTQLLNSNNNKIELVNQNSNPIETQIKSSLINNQNDIKIKEEKKNMENIEESSKYNIINNNMSVNLEARKNSNEKNNIINNEENNEEKNKIINKKSQEEEKYENAISELCGNNEIIELFEIKKWEEKKQGFQKLNQFLNENLENDIIKNNFENIFMFISMKLNNFKETNFNLIKEGIICFNILFSYSKEKNCQLNKKYLETIINNLNEKICDSKIKENYIQLLNTLTDLYSYKTVYELLFEILLKTNKINILKEYSLFIKDTIKKENSINNFELKNLIEFSVKLANNTNPQIRTIAIEIIGLLYTFIGPDLKQLISGIKESTLKLIEKEIDKIKFNKDNENKIPKNKIKDLIVKKNSKNNSDKINESIISNKRIDISKELTPKLLREINRGKWIEKKEGIEYINSVIDKTNNKISKNGLQELFELIKDKLNDGNQNFVKMILQLLNHLIVSLDVQIKFFYNNLMYPLLLKLSDKNKLIRDECLTCIESWIKHQNFEIFAIHIPQLLISNENFELRIELLNLLTKNKELIKTTYPKIFFKELTKAFLTCLQDKNVKIRNATEELIINYSNFIQREKYITELKDIKDTISDYLYNIIDKLLPKLIEENISEDKTTEEKEKEKTSMRQSIVTYDTNNDNDIILVNQNLNLFSPKKINKNKNKRNKMINVAHSLDKKSYAKKSKDDIINKKRELKNETNTINQNNMNCTVSINMKRNKYAKNIKSKLMGYDKLSSTLNKKNNENKFNTINIRTKDINNNYTKRIKQKERNTSMVLNNKNKNKSLDIKQDNNNNNNNNNKKELKSLTAEKLIKYKKITSNNNPKTESFTKRPMKKVNPKKFINANGNDNGKNKLFLSSFKIKKGVKEKRYEKDKKNNLYSELQNFDYLPKIKDYFKNIFTNDFITKIFSNDLQRINSAISQLKIFLDESLNTNNQENFNKLIDNLDLILKVIASKIFNNQTASLIKSFFIFADTLINIYKIRKFLFNDTEINILINIFVDKLTNTNVILKETACNLIWFLNDQIDSSKTFITLVLLLEYKNAKLKSEIIDIIIKLSENSNFDINVYTKVLKNLIREYFEADFNSKKKVLFLLQNIYNIIGNDFWKYTIFLSSKDRDELQNNLEVDENENDMNFERDSSREYDVGDFSGSGFGGEELIDNDIKKKEMHNKSDIDQDDMKLHIKYFKDEDEKINNTKPLLKNNRFFKRSITDNMKSVKKSEPKEVQNIDKNNYCTNIPTKKNIPENMKQEEPSLEHITEKELHESLEMLTNPDEDLVEAIINIHLIAYRNYTQNKKILNQHCDKIISSFIDIITKLFSFEPLRIKIIKYYILVLCKLCNIKEFIGGIALNTQKNLIIFVLSNLLKENLNKLGENGEGMDIYQSLNSIITHVIEFCDINNNIEVIIELEKTQRKENQKFAEYSARCLIIIIQNIKNYSHILNYENIFSKINEILQDFLNEDKDLQPKEKTNQTILITLRNLINEITKIKNEKIIEDYNKWIKEKNISNEKYILNWIKESLNRIKIKNNLIGHTENAENKNVEYDEHDQIIIGNRKKSLNEIKKKYKELQEKSDEN